MQVNLLLHVFFIEFYYVFVAIMIENTYPV